MICSDRQGYGYDAQHDVCMPRDDPGEPGGKAMISVSSHYSIGSSMGINLYTIAIHAFRMDIVERFGPVRVSGVPPGIIAPTPVSTPPENATDCVINELTPCLP